MFVCQPVVAACHHHPPAKKKVCKKWINVVFSKLIHAHSMCPQKVDSLSIYVSDVFSDASFSMQQTVSSHTVPFNLSAFLSNPLIYQLTFISLHQYSLTESRNPGESFYKEKKKKKITE